MYCFVESYFPLWEGSLGGSFLCVFDFFTVLVSLVMRTYIYIYIEGGALPSFILTFYYRSSYITLSTLLHSALQHNLPPHTHIYIHPS